MLTENFSSSDNNSAQQQGQNNSRIASFLEQITPQDWSAVQSVNSNGSSEQSLPNFSISSDFEGAPAYQRSDGFPMNGFIETENFGNGRGGFGYYGFGGFAPWMMGEMQFGGEPQFEPFQDPEFYYGPRMLYGENQQQSSSSSQSDNTGGSSTSGTGSSDNSTASTSQSSSGDAATSSPQTPADPTATNAQNLAYEIERNTTGAGPATSGSAGSFGNALSEYMGAVNDSTQFQQDLVSDVDSLPDAHQVAIDLGSQYVAQYWNAGKYMDDSTFITGEEADETPLDHNLYGLINATWNNGLYDMGQITDGDAIAVLQRNEVTAQNNAITNAWNSGETGSGTTAIA